MSQKRGNTTVRILLLGNSAVGKTSLIVRYIENKLYDSYLTTVGVDFRKKDIKIDGKVITLQIWDSAGQEKYQSISKLYYKKAQGILLIFDLTSRESFDGVVEWLKHIEDESGKDIPIVLVGNKNDLDNRIITTEEALEFANKRMLYFFETSAMSWFNINDAFYTIAKLTWKHVSQKENIKAVTVSKNTHKRKCC